MSTPKETDEVIRVRRRNPGWLIVCNEDGTYTARMDWHGLQQVITVPTLAELDATLHALNRAWQPKCGLNRKERADP